MLYKVFIGEKVTSGAKTSIYLRTRKERSTPAGPRGCRQRATQLGQKHRDSALVINAA